MSHSLQGTGDADFPEPTEQGSVLLGGVINVLPSHITVANNAFEPLIKICGTPERNPRIEVALKRSDGSDWLIGIEKNAICIFYQCREGEEPRPFGTGFFFMRNDLIATAKHIIQDHADARHPYHILVRPAWHEKGFAEFKCIYHIEQDLALIKLEEPFPVTPLFLSKETAQGFIYAGYSPKRGCLFFNAVPSFFTPEPWEGKHSTARFFEWAGQVEPGNSGGPLIGTDGGVAALLSGFHSQVESAEVGQGVSQAIPGNVRGRAIFIGPLLDVYAKLVCDPESIPRPDFPFS